MPTVEPFDIVGATIAIFEDLLQTHAAECSVEIEELRRAVRGHADGGERWLGDYLQLFSNSVIKNATYPGEDPGPAAVATIRAWLDGSVATNEQRAFAAAHWRHAIQTAQVPRAEVTPAQAVCQADQRMRQAGMATYSEARRALAELLDVVEPQADRCVDRVDPLDPRITRARAVAIGFEGERDGHDTWVWITRGAEVGRPLAPHLAVRNHSPTGFDWGYQGSGPAQLALAMCIELVGQQRAESVYQQVKDMLIAPLQDDAWALSGTAVLAAIEAAERG